jgi:hypothetical protein
VQGDYQVPVYQGGLVRLNGNGSVLGAVKGTDSASIVAADPAAVRVYAVLASQNQPGTRTLILNSQSGKVLRTLSYAPQTITIDQRDDRVFLLATNVLTTVNATTGALIYSQTLPEGEVSGIGVDERTSRLFISEYPEAYHDRKAGPATISVVDTHTGRVTRTLSTDRQTLFVGALVVDGPAGVVLSSAGNSGTILDARTGAIRRTVKLANGGLTSPAAVDPATGHIFGFSSGGISELDPKTWRLVRHIPGVPLAGRTIVPDDRAGRIFALEYQHGHDDVRAICTRTRCR